MTIIFPQKAKEIITSPIPSQLIKKKPGKSNADYISGNTVIDYLNYAFGYLWTFETVREWIQESQDKFNPKYDSEPVKQGPVAHVKGRLTVHLQQEDGSIFTITKEQYGSKSVIGGQGEQESVFKAAGTDALKKCASLLGIGLELYRNEDEQYHFDEMNYDNPWTDEMLSLHEENRSYIRSYMQEYELDEDSILPYIVAHNDPTLPSFGDLTPSNIQGFVDYLKSLVEEN